MNFETPEDVVKALYETLSGFRGPRNESLFLRLFLTDARIAMVKQGKVHTGSPEDFLQAIRKKFENRDFFERQVQASVHISGNAAMVVSHYEKADTPLRHPLAEARTCGTNYFSLVRETGRWWILALSWDAENPTHEPQKTPNLSP